MKLNHNISIFAAEALAIMNALKILNNNERFPPGRYKIITDSLSVCNSLSMLDYTAKTHHIIYGIKRIIQRLQQNQYNIDFMWIPSHCGIKGNEKVDQLAKQAIQEPDEICPYKWHPKELKDETVIQTILRCKEKWA